MQTHRWNESCTWHLFASYYMNNHLLRGCEWVCMIIIIIVDRNQCKHSVIYLKGEDLDIVAASFLLLGELKVDSVHL